ncbi:meiotic recombination protein REC8 homolog [Lates japonicus]|uniref:Meiotic recombination protein REC8 homolog n=1 Tax=Lates japonicus TaxID=270547 RepID=A0AAD3NKV8_LATJO|nr:meiotic recombination protein REC8 homolog [Lates japonicus]
MCYCFQAEGNSALGAEHDSVWLLDEELGQPVEVPLTVVALEMTPLQAAMPPPFGTSEKEGGHNTKSLGMNRKPVGSRRRQLVFADPQVQISDRAMKEQIGNRLAETLDLSQVLLDLPFLTKRATPDQLFNAPCGSLPHADLQSLWKQRAVLSVLPARGEKQRREKAEVEEARGESEQDREVLRTERKHSGMREVSSESGLQPAEASSVLDVILDMSKEDKLISDVITPISRWSPQADAQTLMEPIAEENIEMPEVQTDTGSSNTLSWISSNLQRFAEVTFDSLLPPEADRTIAAHTFYKLLELLSAGQKVTLAADETKSLEEGEADTEQTSGGSDSPAGRESPEPRGGMVRIELEWEIPMLVTLPIQVQPDLAHQPFPFLDTTLPDLGIQESEVKERVVWVDTKKTQVKNKAGKLKEKEITILEVRVKAQKPGEKQLQEVLYSTEAHTDRSFCRTGMNILPWKQTCTGENGLTPVQMTMALDMENQQPVFTEAQGQREI